jgi:hypothetical protein
MTIMPVENEDILNAVLELKDIVAEHNAQFREFRGNITVRVDNLEQSAKDTKKWTNIKLYCVMPLTAALHQIAAYFGLIK